jgi:ionotropic glutamate receptor NMDA 1
MMYYSKWLPHLHIFLTKNCYSFLLFKRYFTPYKSDKDNMALNINTSNIVWPGGLTTKPDGSKRSSHLRIVVIKDKPFIFTRRKPDNDECSEIHNNAIDCTWSHGNTTRDYCCYGYCIDMIQMLSYMLKFTYDLYLVPDGLFGDMVWCFFFSKLFSADFL